MMVVPSSHDYESAGPYVAFAMNGPAEVATAPATSLDDALTAMWLAASTAAIVKAVIDANGVMVYCHSRENGLNATAEVFRALELRIPEGMESMHTALLGVDLANRLLWGES